MTNTAQLQENSFLTGSLFSVFIKTASPIILIMLVNGSFTLLDAYFLGEFVGAEALTAVTLMFPAFMLIVALSTLVSSGFSSVLARLLGAGKKDEAKSAFSQAITLSLMVCAVLMLIFFVAGKNLSLMVANGSENLADMAYTYISILIFLSPISFILSINGDTLRCEGKLPLMAAVSLTSVLLNALFNYFLIVNMNMGVAGSAYGTVLAQATSILAVVVYRQYGRTVINTQVFSFSIKRKFWSEYLALGMPSSLSYIGLSLSSIAVLFCLQVWGGESYDATVGAYGIITRIMTFIYLPLLGLSMAFQTIVGNHYGAKSWARTNTSIKTALIAAFIYCLLLQMIVLLLKDSLGAVFVDDRFVVAEVGRILPAMTLVYFLAGPLMMVSTFFQAIGDAKRASILGLAKTYAFVLPLTFVLPLLLGEPGIWYAGPIAEMLMLALTVMVLYHRFRLHGNKLGLYALQRQSV
jgi:MATE family, multidrug efflux pump